ncbi:MAG: redox-regulated ATPase YchF [Bacillota bacterium]
MQLGIVGLPNAGKSTLFNALTGAAAPAAPYPFCTIEPNVGVVAVPDPRLEVLARLTGLQAFPATVRFVDVAGLVRGASRGEGLGNRFLAHLRETDALVHIVRCFRDPNVTHVEGVPDPARDIAIVNTELCLADLETVARRLARIEKPARTGHREYLAEVELLRRVEEALNAGRPARLMGFSPRERELLRPLFLLTARPVLYVANVAEGTGEEDPLVQAVLRAAAAEGAPSVVVASRFEAELAALPPEEQKPFLEDAGLAEPGLNRLVRAAYVLLGLITFFTTKPPEVRAWAVPAGTRAVEAAAKIHSDIARGFIRAEVVPFAALAGAGSMAAARERGLVRLEGRDYLVQDGDVIYFRFSLTG